MKNLKKTSQRISVGIIMGSDSDLRIMKEAQDVLKKFHISFETRIISAHRTPQTMIKYAEQAKRRGIKVIIAGAGGAAHLPGMVASCTLIPVIGVPVHSTRLEGLDAILSIAQMPRGIPVATVAIDNAMNAALLAAQILALSDPQLLTALAQFRSKQTKKILAIDKRVRKKK